MKRIAATIFVLSCLLLAPSTASADDCMGSSAETLRAEGAEDGYGVYLKHGREGWTFLRWDHGEKAEGALSEIGDHAHLRLLVPKEPGRLLVLDTGAGHHAERRVLIYTDTGELLAEYGFDALLTADERERVEASRSISHLQWLEPGEESVRFAADGTTVEVRVIGGRALSFPLAPQSVLP